MSEAVTCESCGAEEDVLRTVRRIYLTPESWDTEASTRVADDTEAWCDVCLTHYPHQLV